MDIAKLEAELEEKIAEKRQCWKEAEASSPESPNYVVEAYRGEEIAFRWALMNLQGKL